MTMYLKFSRLLSDFLLIAVVLSGSISISSCGDVSHPAELPTSEEGILQVPLTIGFEEETDGYVGTRMPDAQLNMRAFDAHPTPETETRAADLQPDALYELHILQYEQNGNQIGSTYYTAGATAIGQKLAITLAAREDCQLLIVARGKGNTLPGINGSLASVRTLSMSQSVFDAIPAIGATQDQMNKMPYVLHLPHVKVIDAGNGKGTIQSTENGTNDVRLFLKRLASRMTLNWTLSADMQSQGYALKEVKLCQVPKLYSLLPAREESQWGTTYPSAVSEFIDTYRLTGADLTSANGSKTVWIPANVRGTSPSATAPIHRTKANAPTAASYAEMVVDNETKKERLYYRAYLGSTDPTDFNLRENTDYNWTLNIKSANYTSDPRIELLDQTPVESGNLVSTANCLMLQPGGNLCFNPYKHASGTSGWNDQLVNSPGTSPAIKTAIASVKVLWQTKDAGTSGDLVLGYVIDDTNHKNLVNITNPGDLNDARVSVKAPVTQGGNAVIAAYAADGTTILWSWHVWVTDYAPVGLQGTINESTRAAAISAAQAATRGGTVHAYDGTSWVNSTGAFYKKVIMDRHLGATRNTYSTTSMMDAARAYGMLYQWGRKDPMPGSLDGTAAEIGVLFDGYGVGTVLKKVSSNSLDYTLKHPDTFCAGLYLDGASWGGGASKTIYDPCPNGWRVSDFSNDATQNVFEGFELKEGGTVQVLVAGKWMNTSFTASQSNFDVSNGFLYKGSVWLPIVRMREYDSGNLRDPMASGSFNPGLIPSFCMWGASSNNKSGWAYEAKNDMPGNIFPTNTVTVKPYGFSVRCIQE